MQILFRIKPLHQYLHTMANITDDNLIHFLNEAFKCTRSNLNIDPTSLLIFLNNLFPNKHVAGKQEDAGELILLLIEHLMKLDEGKDLEKILSIYMQYNTKCPNCGSVFTTTNRQYFLELELLTSNSISNMITEALAPKTNSNPDWNCNSCKKLESLELSQEIIEASDYLLIYLKRFVSVDNKLEKLQNTIQIDPTIMVNSSLYILVGSINHIGKNIDSGHYISFILDEGNKYKCDDRSIIHDVSDEMLRNNSVYILLYKKVDFEQEDQ